MELQGMKRAGGPPSQRSYPSQSSQRGYPSQTSYMSDTSFDNGHMNPAYISDYGSPPQPQQQQQPQYQPIQGSHPSQKGGYYPSAAPPYCGYYPPVSALDVKASQVMVQQQPMERPESYFILTIIVCFFNPIIGPFALWFSFQSKKASDSGDYLTGRKRGNDAMWIAIGGVVCTLVIVFTVLIIVHTTGLAAQPKYFQVFRNDANSILQDDPNNPNP